MIERVAQAIYEAEDGDKTPWPALFEAEKREYRSLAEAAVLSMREPTLEMVGAARDQADCIGDIWRAMVDTARMGDQKNFGCHGCRSRDGRIAYLEEQISGALIGKADPEYLRPGSCANCGQFHSAAACPRP